MSFLVSSCVMQNIDDRYPNLSRFPLQDIFLKIDRDWHRGGILLNNKTHFLIITFVVHASLPSTWCSLREIGVFDEDIYF